MSPPPVFLIGTARSGTTALYELLCSHPDAAWISNWSQRCAPLALLHPRGTDAGKHRPRGPLTIRPVEGYRTFDRALRTTGDGRLAGRSPGRARLLVREVALHRVRRPGGPPPVFVSKNTRNCRGVRVLAGCFPDARFVHLVRHPVPTVTSLMAVEFFPRLGTGWESPVRSFAEAIADGEPPARLAAHLWEWETALAADDLADQAPDRVLRIRYEDLVTAPEDVLTTVLAFAGLDRARHPTFARRAAELRPGPFRDPGFEVAAIVGAICGSTASRVGYPDASSPAR